MENTNASVEETPGVARCSLDRLVGRCVEIGDDDDGQPRLVIHTTREEIMHFGRNLVFVDVEVLIAQAPNAKVSGSGESE